VWWLELEAQRVALVDPADAGDRPRIDASADIARSATLDESTGPIRIGARSRICAGAYIQGPAVIGEDCLVGNHALVRGPVRIGDGARIGFAAEVKNAIIEERVLIGPQCFVADSKLEREAYLGAQVRTSNHRLDGQTVKVVVDGEQHDTGLEKLGCHIGAEASLGIQVIILPGRIIAAGSTFGPRTTVEKNLPRGRYRLPQQLEDY